MKGLPLWICVAAGCASPMATLRDDNKRLNSNVSELRAERRAQDRKLRDLERQLDLARAKTTTAALDAVPNLPVEVATPSAAGAQVQGGPRVVGVTSDGEEIVYEGDAAAGKIATLESESDGRARARDDRDARRPVTIAARSPARPLARPRDVPPDRDGGEAATEYRTAVDMVRAGQYENAVTALRGFLTKHPRHDYADNAQYWLGETFYAAKDFGQALVEFRNVVETYPRGNKVPDALLKVGYCYQALGQTAKARAVLEQVVNLYPKTEPAVLAAKRLEQP